MKINNAKSIPVGERAEESTEELTDAGRKLALVLIEETKVMGFSVPDRTDEEHIKAIRAVDHALRLNAAASGAQKEIKELAGWHFLSTRTLAKRIAAF